MQKITLETKVFVNFDGTHSVINVYAVRADSPETTLVASRKLFGHYSQAQAEREWRMNKRYFSFSKSEKAQFVLANV